ncbi:MAG: hypothetical protein HZA53_18490 [Planctomycetes bacterium]|nr:hypothetical protein [Planctomycetota bacterium]
MKTCECGCNETSKNEFLPGHDQKLRVLLEQRVGGLLALRSLIEAVQEYQSGEWTEQQLGQHVRKLFRRS